MIVLTALVLQMAGAPDRLAREVAELIARGRPDRAFERLDAELAGAWVPPGSGRVEGKTLPTVQTRLGPDAAFVALVWGGTAGPSAAVVVTRDTVFGRLLPETERLAASIDRFHRVAAVGFEPIDLARELGRLVVEPLVAGLPAPVTRLVVAVGRPLDRIPFDLLRLPDQRRVLERFATSLTSSAAVWLTLGDRLERGTGGIVAVGNPRFAPRAPSGRSGGAGPTLRRLPGSGREAVRVAGYGRTRVVMTGREATEAALEGLDYRGVSVVHLATHVVDAEGGRPTLALSPGDGGDGWLSPDEVAARWSIEAEVVVLAACRSAVGIDGLPAAFLAAGARTVVGTLWPIRDRAATAVMDRFYQGLVAGLAPDQALRAAKRWALAAGVSVAEWGGFVAVGDAGRAGVLAPGGQRAEGSIQVRDGIAGRPGRIVGRGGQ